MNVRSVADRTLFIGGSALKASVQIRCRQIAEAIGAAWITADDSTKTPYTPTDLSRRCGDRDLFVLVKANMNPCQLRPLGRVIWDAIDVPPPRNHVDAYITSTVVAAVGLNLPAPSFVIPHHHCNLENVTTIPDRLRGRLLWVGSPEWAPDEVDRSGVEVHVVSAGTEVSKLARIYSRADALLNTRCKRGTSATHYNWHVLLNSGIKVINSIGFGIPSVTECEPWVEEVAAGCTVVCQPGRSIEAARNLLNDEHRYERLRERCASVASRYSIERIASMYLEMLARVAATK